jgi:outer membrane immunogenic protein
MKKFAVASVALVAASLGGQALAADMPLKAPPPVIIYNWTGCYVGLFAGDSSGRSKVSDVLTGVQFAQYNMSGFLGGADVGCNYQVGNWVFGVEGDWAVTNKDGQGFDFPLNLGFIDQTHERWMATARARIGYAITDKWLWYVTGGGAWISVQQTTWAGVGAPLPIAAAAQQSQTMSGYAVGVGTEYAVGYGWSIKSEFLYVDVGTKQFFGPGANGTLNPGFLGENVRVRDYVWKVGMNKKFDWWYPPVVAKY